MNTKRTRVFLIFPLKCQNISKRLKLNRPHGPGYEKYLELLVTFNEPLVVIEEPKTVSKGSKSTEDIKGNFYQRVSFNDSDIPMLTSHNSCELLL